MRGFEKVSEFNEAIIPIRGTKCSAGYDFCTLEEVIILPKKITVVKTGIKAFMNNDEVLEIYIRSSQAFKKGLTLANNVGIIDADYYNNSKNEGHILIGLFNSTDQVVVLEKNEKFAQGIFKKYLTVTDDDVEVVRKGGIGSTN